ncbi:hypothetical protein QE152_g21881 [Popillia japonica]|uniref:Uncharacterized protein n=1 Tax=Popillia japonica TaxID=7064 RepID=A0AAW1KMP6_POPJA
MESQETSTWGSKRRPRRGASSLRDGESGDLDVGLQTETSTWGFKRRHYRTGDSLSVLTFPPCLGPPPSISEIGNLCARYAKPEAARETVLPEALFVLAAAIPPLTYYWGKLQIAQASIRFNLVRDSIVSTRSRWNYWGKLQIAQASIRFNLVRDSIVSTRSRWRSAICRLVPDVRDTNDSYPVLGSNRICIFFVCSFVATSG